MIGVVSTLVALLIGMPLGAIAGYSGGFVDDALMRFTEFFQTIPSFVLAIVLVAILQPALGSIVLAIGVVSGRRWRGWCAAKCCRCGRANLSRPPSRIGQSTPRIIFSQILPNAISPIIVMGSLMVARRSCSNPRCPSSASAIPT